jgi:hypothetical protein
MVIVLTFSSLTRNHLKEYLSAEAFGQSLSTDLEGGANMRAALSQGMSYPVKQEYFKVRLQEAVA